jgi:peptidoglycan hydrolase-like protein with peptidoglycan-binding domain
MHRDLGSWGGGHIDVGDGFPFDRCLAMAGGQPGAAPTPPPAAPVGAAPPLHVDYLGPAYGHNHTAPDVGVWQTQMLARGWSGIGVVDSVYGPQSENCCRQFQAEKGLGVDGLVGPQTWAATWTAAVT